MKSLIILFFIVSCGVDNLNTKRRLSGNNNLSTPKECICTMEYSPVCGSDNKTYENQCIMNCFGASLKFAGNCECKTDSTVCGSDGKNYNECEAKNLNIQIKNFGACGSVGI